MNEKGIGVFILLVITPLILTGILFLLNQQRNNLENFLLTEKCDSLIQSSLKQVKVQTEEVMRFNSVIMGLNLAEDFTLAAIATATATLQVEVLPELISQLKKIHLAQDKIKALQGARLKILILQIKMNRINIPLQFRLYEKSNHRRWESLISHHLLTFNTELPKHHFLKFKSPKRRISEIEPESHYQLKIASSIRWASTFQNVGRFNLWFKGHFKNQGACAWTIQDENKELKNIKLFEGKLWSNLSFY